MRATIAVLFFLCGAAISSAASIGYEPVALSATQISAIESAVGDLTTDPENARFRSLRAAAAPNGATIVCGEVNPKTVFGGYGGYVAFLANLDGNRVAMMAFASDGDTALHVIAQACRAIEAQ